MPFLHPTNGKVGHASQLVVVSRFEIPQWVESGMAGFGVKIEKPDIAPCILDSPQKADRNGFGLQHAS
jgi:hypothetical protein